jgi:hypothetical protein
VVEGLRVLRAELERSDKVDAPPIERICGLIRDMFRLQNSHQDFLKALILDSRFVSYEQGDRREQELRQVYLGFLEHLAGVLRSAAAAGAIRGIDPQLAAFMLSEMMNGCLRRRLVGLAEDTPPEADAQSVIDLFLYGVRRINPERNGQ